MQAESELVRKARKGDQQAFRSLVLQHQQQVRATVIGMLGKGPEADDVAQEVFIRFYKSLDKFRMDASLGTYLTRIAINLSLNELKRKQNRLRKVVYLQKEEASIQIADNDNLVERSDLNDLIQKGLAQLEPDFRAVIVLRLIEGYSVKETAEMLMLPQGTIASRLARAQKKLRTILKELS